MSEVRVLFLALVLVSTATASARAQQLGGQRFTPAGSEDGVLGTEGSELRRELYPYVGLWLNYALDPVVIDYAGVGESEVAEHVLAADLVASMNLVAGLELGFLVPVTLFARGEQEAANALTIPQVDGAAFGDLSIRLAYRFELGDRDSLAIHVPVLLPTAADDDPLALGLGVRPTLAYTHGFDWVDLVLNFSYLWRDRVDVVDYQGGQELGARLGLRIGLDQRWDTALLAEVGASTSLHDFFGAAETPAEGRLGIEHWFGEHVRLTAFGGAGISRGAGAPDLRAGVGVAFGQQLQRPRTESAPGDRDGDGVPDEDDECPRDPEDKDGFQDEDGCPEEDNDQDGVEDADDHCPNEPESQDGVTDDDGCPDRIKVEGSLIVTFEPVRFRTNSDEILPESHAMLREIGGVLEANPSMEIRVEGHTDSEGDDDHNMELSERRAESVKRFLVRHGANERNIEAEGHGETRPIADNETAEGRKQNRRVEFHIAGGR